MDEKIHRKMNLIGYNLVSARIKVDKALRELQNLFKEIEKITKRDKSGGKNESKNNNRC